ncbi:MAG: class I SAM-dependent methyltransferase [Acidobacteriota bacterium]
MLAGLRKRIQKNRYSSNPLAKGLTLALRTPRYLWQFATDGYWRSTLLERLRRPGSVHLTCNYTKMDRYPEIFTLVQGTLRETLPELADSDDLRLLSFGCSTGEEAFSLRRYFPRATILGADISAWNLAKARERNTDARIRFIESTPETLAAEAPFHGIFAMAVLLRMAHRMEPADSAFDVYPFERFDEQILALDELLAPGGVLTVQHANYRVGDTSIAPRYRVVPFRFSERDLVPKFDRSSRRLPETDEQDRVFVKQRSA